MSDNLKFYKGLEQDLPRSNIQIGAIYHCEDTGNTYRGVSANTMELFSTSALTINAEFDNDQILEVSSPIGNWDDFWSYAAFKCKDLQMKIYSSLFPEDYFLNLVEKYEDEENHDNSSYLMFGGKIQSNYYLIRVNHSGADVYNKSTSEPIFKHVEWDTDLEQWRTDNISSWANGTRFFFEFDLNGYKHMLSKTQSAMDYVFDGLDSIAVVKSRPSVPYEFFQSVQEFMWAEDCLYHVGAIPVEKQGIRVGVGHTADASYLTRPKEDDGAGLKTPVLVGVKHNFDHSENDITAFVNREAPITADLARGVLTPYGGLEVSGWNGELQGQQTLLLNHDGIRSSSETETTDYYFDPYGLQIAYQGEKVLTTSIYGQTGNEGDMWWKYGFIAHHLSVENYLAVELDDDIRAVFFVDPINKQIEFGYNDYNNHSTNWRATIDEVAKSLTLLETNGTSAKPFTFSESGVFDAQQLYSTLLCIRDTRFSGHESSIWMFNNGHDKENYISSYRTAEQHTTIKFSPTEVMLYDSDYYAYGPYVSLDLENSIFTIGNNSVIMPSVNGTGYIGTGTKKFDKMYANSFVGNASTATKLANARTFSFSGDVVDTSASFDGSANASITLTLGNSGATAGSYGPSVDMSPIPNGTFSVPYITVDAKGRVTNISSKNITLPNDTTYSAGNGLSLSGTTFSVKASTGISVSSSGVALATSGATAGTYGAASTPSHGGTFAIPSITVDAYGRVTQATTVNVTLPADSNTDTKVKQNAAITTSGNYPVILGYSTATTAVTNTVNKCAAITANPSTGALTATKVYGAVWNDYAEYRQSNVTEPGRVVCENGDDTLSLSTQRLQPGAEVISDTFGFAIGETDIAKTPIAVSGRVLVYTYEDRNTYQPGDAVCAAPGGTVSKMTRDEIVTYPERIIGTVSAVPSYETWGTNNIAVNNRIWIKIK